MITRSRFLLLAAAAVLSAQAFAQRTDTPDVANATETEPDAVLATFREAPAEEAKEPTEAGDALTGTWNGYRTRLEDRGVSIHFGFWGDVFQNVRGGANTADMDFMHVESLNFTFDTEKLFGLKGGTFFIDLQHIGGDNPSNNIGDWQWVSNIAGDRRDQVAEFWYEQKLMDDKVRIKLGKIDATYEFDVSDVAGSFLNASSGLSPTTAGFTTYPDPAFGIVGEYVPCDAFYVRGGVFDGAGQEGKTLGDDGARTLFSGPADLFFIAEIGSNWTLHDLPGKAAIGVTYHNGTFDRFDGGTEDGAASVYLVAEHMLNKEDSEDEEDEQGLSVFVRAGLTDGDTQDVTYHLGGGVVAVGLIDGREDDSTGVALNLVGFSNESAANFGGDELNIELYYQIQVTDYFSITPDVQYIVNPSGDDSLDDALALGMRFTLEF